MGFVQQYLVILFSYMTYCYFQIAWFYQGIYCFYALIFLANQLFYSFFQWGWSSWSSILLLILLFFIFLFPCSFVPSALGSHFLPYAVRLRKEHLDKRYCYIFLYTSKRRIIVLFSCFFDTTLLFASLVFCKMFKMSTGQFWVLARKQIWEVQADALWRMR